MATNPNALVELREELYAKQKKIAEVLEESRDGSRRDFGRKKVLELLGANDNDDALSKFKAANRELEDLAERVQQLEIREIEGQLEMREKQIAEPTTNKVHPTGPMGEHKTFGQMFVESQQFKDSRKRRNDYPLELEIGLKTLFQTSAGFAPESVRSGLLVEAATRPIQVLDLIPTFPINQASFVYMEETTRTHAAAEVDEAGTYQEDTFAWTQKTSSVLKIGSIIPVTDEQLEDEGQVRSLLDQRLRFGLRQKLDSQILVGTGTGTPLQLLGINNKTGVQTQALGTDDQIAAFMKALTKVRFTGRAVPNGAIFHPNDWQAVILLQNTNGDYLFGNPFMGPGPASLLGIPVAVSDGQTENTGLVGDFANFSRLDDRRGVMVQTGYQANDFRDGKVSLRADLRVAFTVTRAAAFCQITGI